MAEGTVSKQEQLTHQRPKEDIRQDLRAVQDEFEKLSEELGECVGKIDSLPDDQRELLISLGNRFEKEDLSPDEIKETCPDTLFPLAIDLKGYIDKAKGIQQREKALQQEDFPYKKTEFEVQLKSLSARINYEAVFAYYREIENKVRERADNADVLVNTATELYMVRKYQHDFLQGHNKENNWIYYERAIGTLKRFEGLWDNKGFLLETPQVNHNIATNFGSSHAERRVRLAQETQAILDQLKEYGRLYRTYRPSVFNNREHVDHGLDDLKRLFLQGESRMYYWENFDQLDFDPDFIAAAERHINNVAMVHNRAGRIKRSKEVLQEEQSRIDLIPDVELLANLLFEGFEAPEGMTLVVNVVDVVREAKDLLPPDFTKNLRTITRKTGPERLNEDDPNVETIGSFKPVFGEGEDWDKIQATEIEIYRGVFVPKDEEKSNTALLNRAEFIRTLWHEFGHNAHYQMDYDEMVAWEKVTNEDPTIITWYAGFAKVKDENMGKREDFAESFMLFLDNPAVLTVMSPLRYQYMLEYFNRHLQSQQKTKFVLGRLDRIASSRLIWERMDYTEEDVRRIYSSFELEEK